MYCKSSYRIFTCRQRYRAAAPLFPPEAKKHTSGWTNILMIYMTSIYVHVYIYICAIYRGARTPQSENSLCPARDGRPTRASRSRRTPRPRSGRHTKTDICNRTRTIFRREVLWRLFRLLPMPALHARTPLYVDNRYEYQHIYVYI